MSTATETATEKTLRNAAERFEVDTAKHELTILHDDGLYRHLMFKQPGTSYCWFELITAPWSLTFRGDGQSFVFSREKDMFGFFRSNPDRLTMRISPDYWAEKLTSSRDAAKAYSREQFDQSVADHLAEAEEEWPGVTAAWKSETDESSDYDLDYEEVARQALSDFEYGAKTKVECSCRQSLEIDADDITPSDWLQKHAGHARTKRRIDGFRFTDTWEWNLADFDWWYLWACHAIVAGIAQYDKAKAEAARPIETVAVTSLAVA
jgi:hypothetical protein